MLWLKGRNHGTLHSVLWSLLHQTTNTTFSLLTPPSLHFLHELSASSNQLVFQHLYPGKWLQYNITFPLAAAPANKALLSPLLQAHTPAPAQPHSLSRWANATIWREGDAFIFTSSWALLKRWLEVGNFLNQTCYKGKVCEISEPSLMRFPFLQQCQLLQASAGFFIRPNPSSHGSNKGTSISICVTMETKRRKQIMVKNNSVEKKVVFLNCVFPQSVHWMVPKRMSPTHLSGPCIGRNEQRARVSCLFAFSRNAPWTSPSESLQCVSPYLIFTSFCLVLTGNVSYLPRLLL